MSDESGGPRDSSRQTEPTRPLADLEAEWRTREAHGPVLHAGERVAGRYQILAFIARGGSGEVYRAEDLELGGHIALKTLALSEASDPIKLERFRREIHLARRVTHPNVCRLHEFGRHHRALGESADPGDGGGDLLFLTMEYLPGETLAARLAEGGRMTIEEAVPIVRQLADGLDAAHRAGVIHRDFKSGNVILVPDDREATGLRAVVTDFGLARAGRAFEDGSGTVTSSGLIVGTPSYMAPEQVEGAPIGPATDLYAFGVVLYEMVTGGFPFTGESALSIAVKRLREPPAPPTRHVPDLDPRWERVILRCLERDPGRRYRSAAGAVAALAHDAENEDIAERSTQSTLASSSRASRRRRAGVAAALTLLGTLGGWALGRRLLRGPVTPKTVVVSAAQPRPAIAVLGFLDLAGRDETAWLGTALSEMLSTELAAGGGLRAVPGETVQRFRADHAVAITGELGPPTLALARQVLASDFLVTGSYLLQGDLETGHLRWDLRLQDAARGETILSVPRERDARDLFRLVAETGNELRTALAAGVLSPDEEESARAALPLDPQAARLYAQGLDKLRRFDPAAARLLFEEALAIEPRRALVHSALADAWTRLGYDSKAREQARLAFEQSAGLPRAERLLVEARFRRAESDWERAIQLHTSLWTFYPDDIEQGLRLAETQTAAGRSREALRTAEELIRLPAAAADPRVALVEGEAAMRLSDSARHLSAASRAVSIGRQLGNQRAIAAGKLQEGKALRLLGRLDEAAAAVQEAGQLYGPLGDREGLADVLNFEAILLRSRGRPDEARAAAEKALALLRDIGNRSGTAAVLNTVGTNFYQQGRLTEAAPRYEEALEIGREIGDRQSVARTLGNLANVLFLQGHLPRAAAAHEEALAVKREIGDRGGETITLIGLASVELERGRLEAARAAFQAAHDLAGETGDTSAAAHATYGLGQVAFEANELATARSVHQRALEARLRSGETSEAAESRLALADLALAEGRYDEAATTAGQAALDFAAEEVIDSESFARAVEAEALLGAGRPDPARASAERALGALDRIEFLGQRLVIQARAARVLGATGAGPRALDLAERAANSAAAVGLVRARIEARLVATALRGEPDALAAAIAEAEQAGFKRLARGGGRVPGVAPAAPPGLPR